MAAPDETRTGVPLLQSDRDPKELAELLVINYLPALTLRLIALGIQGDRLALIYLLNRALGTPVASARDSADFFEQLDRLLVQPPREETGD